VIPALGGAERKVGEIRREETTHGWTGNLTWTPDGQWLAFGGVPEDRDGPGIWLISVRDSERRRITSLDALIRGDWAPSFSSDGRYMAFIRERTMSNSAIYVLPLSGLSPDGPPQKVTGDNAGILGLAWKPDGSGLLFSSGGHLGLSRMYGIEIGRDNDSLRFGTPKLLAFGERARGLSVARTGRVVYEASIRDANLWKLDLASPAPSHPVRIAASTLDE
jgi:Tol biopolymer transport system component